MPTIADNLRYYLRHYVSPHRATIAHLARAIGVIFAITLALEVFVFNFNYFATMDYDTISLKREIHLKQDANDVFRMTEADHTLEFSNLNTKVNNIGIFFDRSQPAQNLTLKIRFTDDAHLRYFDSTEYTVGVPDVEVSTASLQSQYVNLKTTGLVTSLRIEVVGDDVRYPIRLVNVELNAHRPFEFNGARFGFALGLLLVAYAFRPRSAVYRIRILDAPHLTKAAAVGTVLVECALVTTFLFFGSNLVGVATASYNHGEWDGRSLVNTFEVGGDNAQQYAELAKSFAQGHLYLEEEPPDWLKEMDSPYDKGARDEAQKETGEEYLFDVAYYDGHYYVYFGVVPVLLFYLPFYLLTGANFPTAIGVLIAVLAFILGCSALLDRFARYHFKRVSLGLYLLMQIALVAGCGILYLIKFPTFYSLPLACGLAFSVWGIYFWMCGRASKSISFRRRCAFYLAGSLCMALVVGCRPQFLLLSLLAFPLFWRIYVTERRILKRRGLIEFLCLIAPYIAVAALVMMYNYARFGSFTDFGANYNLTVNDMTQRGWIFGRFAPAAFAYFLQPPHVIGTFPFLQPVDFATTYMGQTIKEATFGGILACYPVLWILFFTVPIVRLRNNQRETNTITGVIGVLVASGIVIGLVDAQMAGILQRYYADFSFMFFASVVLLVFIVNENADTVSLTARRLGLNTLTALVAVGVFYSCLLCFVPETGWYSDIYPWAYQDILETVQFWT